MYNLKTTGFWKKMIQLSFLALFFSSCYLALYPSLKFLLHKKQMEFVLKGSWDEVRYVYRTFKTSVFGQYIILFFKKILSAFMPEHVPLPFNKLFSSVCFFFFKSFIKTTMYRLGIIILDFMKHFLKLIHIRFYCVYFIISF